MPLPSPKKIEALGRIICEMHGEDPDAPAIKEPPYMSASGAQIIGKTHPLWQFYAESVSLVLLALDRLEQH